jgi:hypothetical protein
MNLSPDSACVFSDKESEIDADSKNGGKELRAERNMPSLTGTDGAPKMLPSSYGDVTVLLPEGVILQAVRFDVPPFLSNEQAVAAGAEPNNDMAMALMKFTIGIGADSVLETTFMTGIYKTLR